MLAIEHANVHGLIMSWYDAADKRVMSRVKELIADGTARRLSVIQPKQTDSDHAIAELKDHGAAYDRHKDLI